MGTYGLGDGPKGTYTHTVRIELRFPVDSGQNKLLTKPAPWIIIIITSHHDLPMYIYVDLESSLLSEPQRHRGNRAVLTLYYKLNMKCQIKCVLCADRLKDSRGH